MPKNLVNDGSVEVEEKKDPYKHQKIYVSEEDKLRKYANFPDMVYEEGQPLDSEDIIKAKIKANNKLSMAKFKSERKEIANDDKKLAVIYVSKDEKNLIYNENSTFVYDPEINPDPIEVVNAKVKFNNKLITARFKKQLKIDKKNFVHDKIYVSPETKEELYADNPDVIATENEMVQMPDKRVRELLKQNQKYDDAKFDRDRKQLAVNAEQVKIYVSKEDKESKYADNPQVVVAAEQDPVVNPDAPELVEKKLKFNDKMSERSFELQKNTFKVGFKKDDYKEEDFEHQKIYVTKEDKELLYASNPDYVIANERGKQPDPDNVVRKKAAYNSNVSDNYQRFKELQNEPKHQRISISVDDDLLKDLPDVDVVPTNSTPDDDEVIARKLAGNKLADNYHQFVHTKYYVSEEQKNGEYKDDPDAVYDPTRIPENEDVIEYKQSVNDELDEKKSKFYDDALAEAKKTLAKKVKKNVEFKESKKGKLSNLVNKEAETYHMDSYPNEFAHTCSNFMDKMEFYATQFKLPKGSSDWMKQGFKSKSRSERSAYKEDYGNVKNWWKSYPKMNGRAFEDLKKSYNNIMKYDSLNDEQLYKLGHSARDIKTIHETAKRFRDTYGEVMQEFDPVKTPIALASMNQGIHDLRRRDPQHFENIQKWHDREMEIECLCEINGFSREELAAIYKGTNYKLNPYDDMVEPKDPEETLKQIEKDNKEPEKQNKEPEKQNKEPEKQNKEPEKKVNEPVKPENQQLVLYDGKQNYFKQSQPEMLKNDSLDSIETIARRNGLSSNGIQQLVEANKHDPVFDTATLTDLAGKLGVQMPPDNNPVELQKSVGDSILAIFGKDPKAFPGSGPTDVENKNKFINDMLTNPEFLKDPDNKKFVDDAVKDYQQNVRDDVMKVGSYLNETMGQIGNSAFDTNALGQKNVDLKNIVDTLKNQVSCYPDSAVHRAAKDIMKTEVSQKYATNMMAAREMGAIAENGLRAQQELKNNKELSDLQVQEHFKSLRTMATANTMLKSDFEKARQAFSGNKDFPGDKFTKLESKHVGKLGNKLHEMINEVPAPDRLAIMEMINKEQAQFQNELNKLGTNTLKSFKPDPNNPNAAKNKQKQKNKEMELDDDLYNEINNIANAQVENNANEVVF